uniref:Uncharacterized protein n=1 Tax=Panagrolaimus sp. JU765 TaxID=591449 RepID=A0AC34QGU1_9BILA
MQQFKNQFLNELETIIVDEHIGVVIKNVEEAVIKRLEVIQERFADEFEKNELGFCVATDKGGPTTKFVLIFGCISENRHAPSAGLLLGEYFGDEKHHLLQRFMSNVVNFVNETKEIVVKNKKFAVNCTEVSDLKCFKIMKGLRESTSTYSCYLCTAKYCKTMEEMIRTGRGLSRSYSNTDAQYGQDHDPIFSNILAKDTIIPFLHLFMGICGMIINFIIKALWKAETNENVDVSLTMTEEDQNVVEELSAEIEEQLNLLEEWKSLAESLETVEEPEVADDIDEDFACDSATCLYKLTGLLVPERGGNSPDFITTNAGNYHTICAGITSNTAKKSANPRVNSNIDRLKHVVKKEIDEIQQRKQKAETKLEKLIEKANSNLAFIKQNSKFVKKLFWCFEKFGASPKAWYQTFTGNHVRLILKNAHQLLEMLDDAELGISSSNIPEVKAGVKLLTLLGRIQSYTHAKQLEIEEQKDVEFIIEEMTSLLLETFASERPGHKLHVLLFHVVEFMKNHGYIAYYSEQIIEAVHAKDNEISRRCCLPNKEKKLKYILNNFTLQNYIFDKYGTFV